MRYTWVLICLLTISGCSAETTMEFEHFLDRLEQTATERNNTAMSEPNTRLNLADFNIYSAGHLVQNRTHLFFVDFGNLSVVKISKSGFQEPVLFTFNNSSGPGELQAIRSVAVAENELLIGDPRQLRIVLTDIQGHYIRDIHTDFSPDNLFYLGGNRILNFNAHQQDHLFTVCNVEADTATGFEEITFDFEDSMKYPGYLSVDNEHIFYAGYSEPILKKYTTEGELIFSRAIINNFDTADQYVYRTMGERRMVGFSEDALYSSMDIAHFGSCFIVIPHHHGNEEATYLDMYDASDGSYKETLSIHQRPPSIAVDDDHLYLLVQHEDDMILERYPNPLRK